MNREKTSQCSAVCSTSYSTEPSARRILDSPTQHSTGQFLPCGGRKEFVKSYSEKSTWFATTGVRRGRGFVIAREFQCRKHLLGTLIPSQILSIVFHQAFSRSKAGSFSNKKSDLFPHTESTSEDAVVIGTRVILGRVKQVSLNTTYHVRSHDMRIFAFPTYGIICMYKHVGGKLGSHSASTPESVIAGLKLNIMLIIECHRYPPKMHRMIDFIFIFYSIIDSHLTVISPDVK